nr:putative reverse transcriptase domain-containing protein [Tanacetum cinerariifolium]
APFGGLTDWYPGQGYREPGRVLDSLDESVRSSISRVILIGFIPIEVPVAPEVGAAAVASPTNILVPDTYSSSESGLLEGQDIPVGRLYRTHPDGPCRALTIIIRPFISDHSSADHSLADHTSGHSTSDQSLSRHTLLAITVADSSSPSKFVYRRPTMTLRGSEVYLRWRYALLSTMYPPTTSESSTGDSSSESPVRPSRKRCRSPTTTTVPSSITSSGALVPTHDDLLSPHKRLKDYILPEDSVEEDIDANVLADIEADVVAIKVAADMDVEAGVNASIDVVVEIDILDGMLMPDTIEHLEQVEEDVHDIYGHVMVIPLQRLEDIETRHRQLEEKSLIASGERAVLLDRVAALERINVRLRGTLRMESVRANRLQRHMDFTEDKLRQICRFLYYDRLRFRRLEAFATRRLEPMRLQDAIQIANNLMDQKLKGYAAKIATTTRGAPEPNQKNMTITRSGMTLKAIEELIAQQGAEELATYEANRATKLVVESQIKIEMMVTTEMIGEMETKMETKTVGEIEMEMEEALGIKILIGMIEVLCLSPVSVLIMISLSVNHSTLRELKELSEPMRLQDAIQIANNLMDQKLKGYAAKSIENKKRLDKTRRITVHKNPFIRDQMLVDRMWREPTQLVTTKEWDMLGLGLTATSVSYIMRDSVLSFVSTTFSALLNVIPSTLDVSYVVEIAEERVAETNTLLRGYTLGLLGHPFNIDLMPVELGSFDVIISMDWLANHHAVIVYDENIIRIPYGDEKYIKKGCPVFLAQVTEKEVEEKSTEKGFEDVPTIRGFPKDLPVLPPTRQVEFQIDLVLGAAPIAQAPYRLAPLELQELSTQLQF